LDALTSAAERIVTAVLSKPAVHTGCPGGFIAAAVLDPGPGEAQVIPAAGIRIDEQHSY
jgi:hypothetical protein